MSQTQTGAAGAAGTTSEGLSFLDQVVAATKDRKSVV